MACKLKIKNPFIASFIDEDEFETFSEFKDAIQTAIVGKSLFPQKQTSDTVSLLPVELMENNNIKIGTTTYDPISLVSLFLTQFSTNVDATLKSIESSVNSIKEKDTLEAEDARMLESLQNLTGTAQFSELRDDISDLLDKYSTQNQPTQEPPQIPPADESYYVHTFHTETEENEFDVYNITNDIALARQVFLKSLSFPTIQVDGQVIPSSKVFLRVERDSMDYIQGEGVTEDMLNNVVVFYVLKDGNYQRLFIKGDRFNLGSTVQFTTDVRKAFSIKSKVQLQFWLPNLENEIYSTRRKISPEAKKAVVSFKATPDNTFYRFDIFKRIPSTREIRTISSFKQGREGTFEVVEENKEGLRKGQIILKMDGEKVPFYTRKVAKSYREEIKELINYALLDSTSLEDKQKIEKYLKNVFLETDYSFFTKDGKTFTITSAVILKDQKLERLLKKKAVTPEMFFQLLEKNKSEARISKEMLKEGAMFTRLVIKDNKLTEEQMLASKWLEDHLITRHVQFKSKGELKVAAEYFAVITFNVKTGDIIPPVEEVITVGNLLNQVNKADLSEASLLLYSLIEKANLLEKVRDAEVRFAEYNAVKDGVVYLKNTTSVDILLHEVVHLLTSDWINNNESSSQVTELAKIARQVGITYGTSPSDATLAKELLANLSNQDVVDKLKSTKAGRKSLLDQLSDFLKEIFKSLFSPDYTDTLYEEVVTNFLAISAGKELNYGELNPVSGNIIEPELPLVSRRISNRDIDGASIEDKILAFKSQIEKTEGSLYIDSIVRSIEGDLASLLAKDMLALLSGQLNYDDVFESLYAEYYFRRFDENKTKINTSLEVDKFLDFFLYNKEVIKEIFFRENKVFTFTKVKTDKVKTIVEDTVESVETTPVDTDSPVEEPVVTEEVTEDEDAEVTNDIKESNKAALEEGVKKETEFGRNGNTYNFEEAAKEIRYLVKMLPAIEMEDGKPKIYTLAERNEAVTTDIGLGTQFFFKIPGQERLFIRVAKDANGAVQLTDHTETWNKLSYMFKDKMSIEEMLFDTFSNPNTLDIVPEFYALYSWLTTSNGEELNDSDETLHIYTSFEKAFKRYSNPLFKTLDDNGVLAMVEEGADVSIITDRLINDRFRQFVFDTAINFYNPDTDTFNLEGFLNSDNMSLLRKSRIPEDSVADYVLEVLGFRFSEKLERGSIQTFRDSLINFLKATGRINDLPMDIARFIRADYIPPAGVVLYNDKNEVVKKVAGINSRYKIIHQLQHKIAPYTFSPIVKNAEGQNQSTNSIPNSILYEAAVYSREPLQVVQQRIPRAKNPMFEKSLLRQKLFDSEGNKKPGVTISIVNYSGVSIVQEGQASKGALNVDLTERQKVVSDFSNFLTKGLCENTRAQVASTSYAIQINQTLGNDLLFGIEVSEEAYNGPNEKNVFYKAVYDYLEGELAEIEGLPEKDRKLVLFDSKMISENLQKKILKDGAQVHKAEFLNEIHQTMLKDMAEFKQLFLRNGGAYLLDPKGKIQNSITRDIKILQQANNNDLQKAQDIMFFHFIANKFAFYVEETILFQGSLRKLSEKDYFKRANTVQSTKYPPTASAKLRQRINDRLKNTSVAAALGVKPFELKDTFKSATEVEYVISARNFEALKQGFKDSLTQFYIASGVTGFEASVEKQANELLEGYKKVKVQDGSGRINPDAYISLLLSLGAKPIMFKAYRALMLDMIYNKNLYFKEEIEAGVLSQEFIDRTLSPEEIAEMEEGLALIEKEKIVFPSLKWSYRGGVVRQDPNQKVADEALDKFSLFPLFIQYVYDKPVLKAEMLGMINQGLAYIKVKSGTKLFSPEEEMLTDVTKNRINKGFEIDFSSSTHELLTSNLGEQIDTPTIAKTENTFGSQFRKLILAAVAHLNIPQLNTALRQWDDANQKLSDALENKVLKEFGIQERDFQNVDVKNIARVLRLHAQKREMTKNVLDFLEGVESGKYTDFSHSFNKREVENLISNIVKRIAVQKLTGSQLIQVAPSQDDDLAFYKLENGVVSEAECKVTMMGHFLNLFNLPEVKEEIAKEEKVNIVTKVRAINRLLKDPAFREKYKQELTIVTYRIPTQLYNSMDVFVIKEFLPTFQGPQIVLPPEAVVKSGTDYDYDKAPSIFPVIGKDGRLIKGTVPLESLKELKDEQKRLEDTLSPLFEAKVELKNLFKKIKELEENIDDTNIDLPGLASLLMESAQIELELKENLSSLYREHGRDFKKLLEVKRKLFLKRNLPSLYQNQLLETAKSLLKHPVNFFKLITPNSDALIMKDIDEAFEQMGIDMTNPTGSDIVRYSTNLRKWKVVKGADLLGIAATSNTLITLLQRYKAKFNPSFFFEYGRNKGYYKTDVHFGLLSEQEKESILSEQGIDVSNPFDHSGVLRQEMLTQLINVTVDLPGNDRFGASNFTIDNFGAALYLIIVQGVPFKLIVNLFHQPVVYKYHNLVEQYTTEVSPYTQRKYTRRQARILAIYDLFNLPHVVKESESGRMFHDFDLMESRIHKSMEARKKEITPTSLPPLINISEVYTSPTDELQKNILMYYLSVLIEGEALRKVNSLINFDRAPDNLVIKTLNRDLTRIEVQKEGFINMEFINTIENNSVISGLNVKEVLTNLSQTMFPALYSDVTLETFKDMLKRVTSKDAYYNKVTNDFLSSIVQTFGVMNYEGEPRLIKEIADEFLIGTRKYQLVKFAKGLNEIMKLEGRPMRLLEIMVNSISRKTMDSAAGDKKINNVQLVMGFENSGEDKNRLIEEFRQLLNHPRANVKKFAETLAAVGIIQSGYSKSPLFFSDIIPEEFISPLVMKAVQAYLATGLVTKSTFISAFAKRFENIEGALFNNFSYREAYRYKNYRLLLLTASEITALQPVEYTPYEEVETRTIEVTPSQPILSSGEVTGEEISSYSDNLAFALTNPTHTSPTGKVWSRTWTEGQKKWRDYLSKGIEFDGVVYQDVEEAYQKNKNKYPIGESRNEFMKDLIKIKLQTYPKLVEGIDAKGGINYILKSTHQPTKQNSYWETGGENGFIRMLAKAYSEVTEEKQPIQNQPSPTNLKTDENLPCLPF